MAVNNLNTPGTGIQPTLVDAKGDLIAGVANDAVNRLAVGINGQVLVADSGETTGLKWNNPGTVGGLVHINTITGTGVTAINVNDVFSSTYQTYFLTIDAVNGSNANILLRMRVGGSDNTTSNYFHQNLRASVSTVAASSATGTSFNLTGGGGAIRKLFFGYVYTPNNATETFFDFRGATTGVQENSTGFHNVTTSYTGLTILASSGNLNNAVIRVYGLRN